MHIPDQAVYQLPKYWFLALMMSPYWASVMSVSKQSSSACTKNSYHWFPYLTIVVYIFLLVFPTISLNNQRSQNLILECIYYSPIILQETCLFNKLKIILPSNRPPYMQSISIYRYIILLQISRYRNPIVDPLCVLSGWAEMSWIAICYVFHKTAWIKTWSSFHI